MQDSREKTSSHAKVANWRPRHRSMNRNMARIYYRKLVERRQLCYWFHSRPEFWRM